ncbi:MAG: TlyA family RNA methyltransferase [Alphaproteobacteria bacterium]|nr:TlyA family RNA methyltransferase [Alphaproteobacteria bacterium]
MAKQRVDALLVARGLASDLAKARALIMAGSVFAGTRRMAKPGDLVSDDLPLEIRGREHPWVSRGGLKLVHGLDHFKIDPAGLICVDIGASTGGFTDVLLSRGARQVFAVDVGYGQLAQKLRDDPRVTVLERTNARALTPADVTVPIDLIACDASFIGLRTVLPASLALAAPGARLVALIKPQFEAAPEKVGPKGVVSDSAVHADVCETIRAWLAAQPGWQVLGITPSPITGPEGNVEFLIAAARLPYVPGT